MSLDFWTPVKKLEIWKCSRKCLGPGTLAIGKPTMGWVSGICKMGMFSCLQYCIAPEFHPVWCWWWLGREIVSLLSSLWIWGTTTWHSPIYKSDVNVSLESTWGYIFWRFFCNWFLPTVLAKVCVYQPHQWSQLSSTLDIFLTLVRSEMEFH